MHTLKFTGDYLHWIDEEGKVQQSFAARCAPMKAPTAGSSIASRRSIRSGDYTLVEQNPADVDSAAFVFERVEDASTRVVLCQSRATPDKDNTIHVDDELFGHVDALNSTGFSLRVSYEQSHFMKTTVAQPGRE